VDGTVEVLRLVRLSSHSNYELRRLGQAWRIWLAIIIFAAQSMYVHIYLQRSAYSKDEAEFRR
jgi:hypothetical protein